MPPPERRYVNTAELDAARDIVRLTIAKQRTPTEDELWPVLKAAARHSRELKVLRDKERIQEVGERGHDRKVVASRSLIRRKARELLERHADLLKAKDDIELMRQEIARTSFRTLLDGLERDGPYDHNAQLADAKMRYALQAIKMGGHSLEETTPQTQVNVNVLPPGEEEAARIRAQRERLYREQLAAREGKLLEVAEADFEVAEAGA